MIKALILTSLLLAGSIGNDDRFACAKPEGQATVDEDALLRAIPNHIDRVLPQPLVVDFACAIDRHGRLVECDFAARQPLTERQKHVLSRIMPRAFAAMMFDIPNQPCVASTLTLQTGAAAEESKSTPDEPAG